MKNCANCGQGNYDNQMNCGRCGAVLNQPNFQPNQQQGFNQPIGNQPNFQQPFGNQQPNSNQPMPVMMPKKSSVGKIVGIVGGSVVALGLIGGLLIFLLVTQTLQWKITGKWRIDSVTISGKTLPMPSGKESTGTFNWDQTYTIDTFDGKTERGTYRVVNETTVSMTNNANNETANYTVTMSGKTMTMTATKQNITVSMGYTKIK
ncbi:hypothetical protein BH10ACI1_BH10ACI1_24160 [soil metagenome]